MPCRTKACITTPITTITTSVLVPKQEQQAILEKLASKCHSAATLASARFPIGPSTAPPPATITNNNNSITKSTTPFKPTRKYAALAIDCEMVGIDPQNTSHLGQVVAVDILTGKTVLDICVQPPVTVRNWRNNKSGLSPAIFREYKKRGKLVAGVTSAQNALYNLIDTETILVGHALENDIRALGIVHGRLVDTQILMRELVADKAGFEPCRSWGLKMLALHILGRDIQDNRGKGGGGGQHNCMEDTIATRDLALAVVRDQKVNPLGMTVGEWADSEVQCAENFPARVWESFHPGTSGGDWSVGVVDAQVEKAWDGYNFQDMWQGDGGDVSSWL
ncbi:ribonuclease H-like domain-containing protein [Aspergillus heterothallicus]